jgi:hypothetical protein
LLNGSLQFWHALTIRSGVQLHGFEMVSSSMRCSVRDGSVSERYDESSGVNLRGEGTGKVQGRFREGNDTMSRAA